MTTITLRLSDLVIMAPECILLLGVVVLTLADLWMKSSRTSIGIGALVVLCGALAAAVVQLVQETDATVLFGAYEADAFSSLCKIVLLLAACGVLGIAVGTPNETHAVGEMYTLYIPALMGAMLLVSSREWMTTYVALELLTISTIVLIGMRRAAIGKEAAMKLIVLGGVSSAFLLYGISFLYGCTGTTYYEVMASRLDMGQDASLITIAFVMIVASIAVKIALVPFHAWALDVGAGAAVPVAAFLSVVSKLAAIILLWRVCVDVLFPHAADVVVDVLFVLVCVSLVVAHVLALRQVTLLRLFAVSGIAHAALLLVPLIASGTRPDVDAWTIWLYYAVAYVLMNVGAFAAISLTHTTGTQPHVHQFAGLVYRAPWTAVAIVCIVLSLAGLPVSAGFFGKLFILLDALSQREGTAGIVLAALIVVGTVISFAYYFRIVRQMFWRPEGPVPPSSVRTRWFAQTVLWGSALGSVALGCAPGWLMELLAQLIAHTVVS
jgi:NADH-quinone oxidoreductase subunit N